MVSLGLITTYAVLIYNMCKYFREQMRTEIKRLTILFASFIMAYVLRIIFQIGLGGDFYS